MIIPGRVVAMASRRPLSDYVKIVVVFEPRADGGLRAYSDDVPGFVLSHSDPVAVLADVKSALEGILSHMYGTTVIVEELRSLREELSHAKEIQRTPSIPPAREYVTHVA